jgi:YesN/AraC family two-component response regulator
MPVGSRGTASKRVLIVDDDPAALEAMEAALVREFGLSLATDVLRAQTALDRDPVDLVILDVVLPGESGLDFLARLREQSEVPILLISGYGTKEMVIEGLRARASDYLDKPFTTTQLLDKARALLAQGPRPGHVSERIRRFVQENYMQDWTVHSLAKALHLSIRTMRQMFRRRYRQSVMDYLEEVRVTRARDLLATTDLPIQTVATEVGFRDPHYFSRVFRQRVGTCPRTFRSEQRRDHSNSSPAHI